MDIPTYSTPFKFETFSRNGHPRKSEIRGMAFNYGHRLCLLSFRRICDGNEERSAC